MKKYFIFATALAALASCSSDDFVGESPNGVNSQVNDAISFSSGTGSITRATVGGILAAQKLGNNFVVEGTKTMSGSVPPVFEVFDNYNVNFTENTAATSASNTADWEYVAQAKHDNSGIEGAQTIKYWDFAASQYDFWAYSVGGGGATVTALGPDNSNLNSSAYTITATKADMEKVYISDLVTAYPIASTLTVHGGGSVPKMGDEVNLTFRSLMAKIRIGLYETIPGYSVKSVNFYPASDAAATTTPALYATGANLPAFASTDPYKATFKVYFQTIGSTNTTKADYNMAHVVQTSSDKASNMTFAGLSYGDKERAEQTSGSTNWLARSVASPTWAGDGSYTSILPYETGEVMTLKVNYTLESIDGTGETITVYGATAIIPANYTMWKANYAYTYIFKISDNTNGMTNTDVTSKVGLYPVTLDAVVVSNEDGTQETITTVATPSITTYSITSNVTTNDVYTTADDIYVCASTDGAFISLTDKAVLYDITDGTDPKVATEAEVHDALTKYTSLTSGSYVGRNGIHLEEEDGLKLDVTSVPLVDGNSLTVSAGQVAQIKNTALTAGHYYAFVYVATAPGDPTTKNEYTTVDTSSFENGVTDVSSYYTTLDGITYTKATGKFVTGTNYYQLHTYNETNGVYAVKVIKIKS